LTRALFICGKARMRSPTAADLVTGWGIKADFAGLSADADEQLSSEQLDWAEIVFVMEARQAKRLQSLFPKHLRGKKLVVLNIPDDFAYGDPDLVALLTARLRPLLMP
jgi:predicted protein tyrosine phosphatase